MDRDYGPRFTLQELIDATGVPRRTVRFYIAQGLVPPAAGKGRYAYYNAEHVESLARIKELRTRNLSIDEIRQVLDDEQSGDAGSTPGVIWRRIQLHPDLEIHVKDDSAEHVQSLVRQIQDSARHWFGQDDDS